MKITFCKIENGTGIAKYSFICFVRHEKLLPCIKTNFYLSLFHQNQGVVGQGGLSTNRTFLRYGILPRENLCTENLTPWKKLLPCKNRRGLAVLLSSGHMQKYSVYFSIGLELKPVCSTADCSKVFIQYTHTIWIIGSDAISSLLTIILGGVYPISSPSAGGSNPAGPYPNLLPTLRDILTWPK